MSERQREKDTETERKRETERQRQGDGIEEETEIDRGLISYFSSKSNFVSFWYGDEK